MTNYNYARFSDDGGPVFRTLRNGKTFRCAEGHLTTIEPCYICHCNEQARLRRLKMARAAKRRKASV